MTTPPSLPPVAPLPLWEQVTAAAAGICQCSGACGNRHAKSGGRCDRANGHHAGKHAGPVRLLAAPADPALLALPAHQAARLPAAALAAWCPDCHHGAQAAAQRAARTAAATALTESTDPLF